MSNFLDNWRKRNLGDAKTIEESDRNEMIDQFDEYLEDNAMTKYEIYYTYPDTIPNVDNIQGHPHETMSIIDVAINDKTHYDEKFVYCRITCPLEVGCYINFEGIWYVVEFEEFKPTRTHKKFTLLRCNNILNLRYKGEIFKMPVNIVNLTLYSKGEHDYKYITVGDAKIRVSLGSNEATKFMIPSYRIFTRDGAYKITHLNRVDYTQTRTCEIGMITWLCQETYVLREDDEEALVAYNPIGLSDDNVGFVGSDTILIGEKQTYKIEDYEGELEFILDGFYPATKIISADAKSCVIKQEVDFDEVGNMVSLIARDNETKETVDIMNIIIRGN